MDNEIYLKELAKHVQRNNIPPKDNNLNQKKIQVKTFKVQGEYERLITIFELHKYLIK